MRRFPLRRFLGALLSFAIVAGAPGSDLYRAAAQTVGAGAAESASSVHAVPALGMGGLSSPIPSLSPSALSVAPSLLSAPAAAPEAIVAPAIAVQAAVSAAVPVAKALAVSPVAVSAAAAKPVAARANVPAALSAVLPVASTPEKLDESGKMFDGASAKRAIETPVLGGFRRALKRGLTILTLSAGLFVAQNSAHAQTVPLPPVAQAPAVHGVAPIDSATLKKQIAAAIQAQLAQLPPPAQTGAAPAQANPAPADTAEVRKILPRPVEAQATIDRQGVTVGERIHITFTLHNTSDKPVSLQNLRAGIQDALPENLELEGTNAEQPLVLAPGETKTITYEAIPFGSGVMTLDGGLAVVQVNEAAQYPEGIEIVLPKTELTVKTVLTPDWKDKGLKDIVGVKRGDGPDWMWLAAIPLGLLLLVGVKRLVDARRLYPKLDTKRLSLVAVTEAAIARLKLEAADLDSASFYARYQDLLSGFMVDFAGLPKAARDARTLGRDLHKTFYDVGQVDVASRLAAQAEAARFAGAAPDAAERGRLIDQLSALVTSVAERSGKAKPKAANTSALGVLALLPGAAGLSFGSPYVLLLLIPFFAYVLWSWRARAKGERFAVSSTAQTPKVRTWRERFAGLPRVLRLAAVGLIVVALARPMIGTQRTETYIPSTDTMISIDLSGSMSGAKLDGVRDAVRVYVEEQRRGTENRVGMVTFSDNAYLDVKLTTDYDALIAHLKELQTTGSTAIGKSMLTSIAHFLELNALDLDGKADPRALTVQKLLRDQGLSAALEYAKQYPDLMKQILQPERAKIVVIFTDGDSNTGITPEAAADIAAQLGVKVYGVGIAGPNEGFNEGTLRAVAEKTGAKFYRAGDADAMRQVLLEISHLEKSPAKIVSSVSVKDYTSLLALLAALMLGGELLLANTRLRTLYGMAILMGLSGSPLSIDMLRGPALAPAQITMTAQVQAPKSATSAVPQEVIDGNKLYNQGLYAEALKKYGEAVERHPDVPEIYFNMADAYLRLGQNDKADAAWQKYLSLTQDPKKQSQTIFNLGNSALAAGDAQKAMEMYKEALRRDAGNMDAKWNLEALKQAQKEQQQQQQPKDGKQKGKPGKQKGKPGDGKPGDGKPGDGKPGDGKPGQGKPGQGQPGDGKGDGKPQPGATKPDAKQGADKLGQALGQQEGQEKGDALKGMTRKGSGVWGFMPALPLAFIGHGIVFSSTAFLWAVGIGLPVAALLLAYGLKKRLDAAKKLSPGTAPKSFRSWWGARRFLGKSALALTAVALIGLAAGNPRGGMTDERVNFGGKDLVVAVDGSYSMEYAEDGRMERTQKELNEFITRLQGTDRVGLVVFAGASRTASPISIDYGNFEFKINRLDVEARGLKEGSDLAGAVKYSANHFELAKKIGDRQRILIVISDGDVPDADIASAIAAATEHGVTVYTIGVGDAAGTKIKLPTADGKGTEYLIDAKTGAPAVTRLVEAPLRQLAERTGGAYFRADGHASIDKILDEVSRLEKGQKGDTIKSPRPIGVWLLWPALMMLLLDLVLPGRSLLKRDAPKPGEKIESKDKPKGPGGAAMLGAALIPLGAWPQILPFAALATVVLGYLAADSWSGGSISRRIKEAWQTWRGVVPQGVSADLIHLYDLREADERRLTAFVKGWQDAKEPLRATLIDMASHDEALWREKLTAAYLSGAEPETMEKILTTLRRVSRSRLEPLKPVTERMGRRQADISWMDHSDARARLATLSAVAAGQPLAFEAPTLAPKPSSRWARFKRGATVALLSLMIGLTAVSSIGTVSFQAEQRAAAEASTKLFYAEDLFIFSDRYVDSRIPEEVLPALKRWTESPKTAGADFERALTILRESPDPKADNILIAVFRRAGVLPLTSKGESIMLLSLIERDNDAVWASMDQLISTSRSDPASAQLLVKLVVLGVESGNDKAIVQLFRVLKSPNKEVQQAAAGILFAHLSQDGGAKFFPSLLVVQAKHAGDPVIQLWTASFAFRRLADPAATEADLVQAKSFLDQALVNAHNLDQVRAQIYKQTPPDQEVQAPPSMVTLLVNIADKMQGDGGAPAPVAGAARYLVAKATTDLIKDAEKTIPGLHERLIKDGVVLPDTKSSNGYGGYEGYYDERMSGYETTQQNYREVYKLGELQTLQADIAEMGGALVTEPTAENAPVRDLLDRSEPTIEKLLEAGAKSGMMAGGTAPEAVADQLLPVLQEGDGVFTGHSLLRALRDAKLAPAVGDFSSQLAYPETLDAAQLSQMRDLLAKMAASGQVPTADGKTRPMSWSEKLYLAGALRSIDAARVKNFPDAAAPAPLEGESLVLAGLSNELKDKASDPAFALSVEKRLIERGAKVSLDSADAAQILTQVFATVKGTSSEAAAIDALASALKGPSGSALAAGARARASESFKKIAEQAETAFPAVKDRLLAEGVRESAYAWRGEFKLRHYRVAIEAISAAAKSEKSLTDVQKSAVAAAKDLGRYESLAALAGTPAGDSPAELAADEANMVLIGGYHTFPGSDFNIALRDAGLMPAGTGNGLSDYAQSYTQPQLIAVRDWLKAIAAADVVPKGARVLSWTEKRYLIGAIARVDEILAQRYGVPAEAAPAGIDALSLARLSFALEAHKGDAAFALKTQEQMLVILAARPADADDAVSVLALVRAAVRGASAQEAQLAGLVAALKTPSGKVLADAAKSEASDVAEIVGDQAESAFAPLENSLLAAGVQSSSGNDGEDERSSSSSEWRLTKLRHYRVLRAEIAAAAAAVKNPTAEQRAVAARAERLLPLAEQAAALAGVPAGDAPGEIAAEFVNDPLQKAYQNFPGAVFNDQLRALGLMASSGNSESDHYDTYTRAQLVKLRSFLAGVQSSGQGWESDGTTRRALTDQEKADIDDALAAANRALAAFPAPKAGLHALAPFALAALPGLAPWMLFTVLGLGAAYLIWKMLGAPDQTVASDARREEIPGSVLARHRRIELSARRMATAVNGGNFRSRFIGAGGTDFAEARPYQGEDMREIDWKTSAKKDELYAKKFELERDMALMLVIDISRSGRFGTRGTDKRTAIEDAAAVLALAAAHSNVRVGAVLVSDRVEQVIPPRGGSRHAMSIVDAILKAEPTGTATDLKPGLETASHLLSSRAMVAVLSDFIAPDFKDALGALASRHDVRAIRVTDPAEMSALPDVGLLPVVDAETGATRMLDTSSKVGRAEAASNVSRREAAVEAAFDAAHLKPISISTEGDPLESLELSFHPKTKQPFKP